MQTWLGCIADGDNDELQEKIARSSGLEHGGVSRRSGWELVFIFSGLPLCGIWEQLPFLQGREKLYFSSDRVWFYFRAVIPSILRSIFVLYHLILEKALLLRSSFWRDIGYECTFVSRSSVIQAQSSQGERWTAAISHATENPTVICVLPDTLFPFTEYNARSCKAFVRLKSYNVQLSG